VSFYEEWLDSIAVSCVCSSERIQWYSCCRLFRLSCWGLQIVVNTCYWT